VVTAFGRRAFLRGAVESVSGQATPALPVQIVVVKDFSDPPIDSFLRRIGALALQPTGTELGSWISQALSVAEGTVLAFLDDDDLFLPGHLVTIERHFRETPRLGYFRSGIVEFSGDPSLAAPHRAGLPLRSWWVGDESKDPRTVESLWRAGAAFNHSSIAVRRELVEAFRTDLERLGNGYSAFLFYAALVSRYGILFDPQPGTRFRLHAGNESPLAAGSPRQRWERTFRLAAARAHDAELMITLVRQHRPTISTQPLERVWARNRMYLSWTEPHPSRRRRAQALGRLLRADGLRNIPHDSLGITLGGLATLCRSWVPMRTARRDDPGTRQDGTLREPP
jgi:hypothetical protein